MCTKRSVHSSWSMSLDHDCIESIIPKTRRIIRKKMNFVYLLIFQLQLVLKEKGSQILVVDLWVRQWLLWEVVQWTRGIRFGMITNYTGQATSTLWTEWWESWYPPELLSCLFVDYWREFLKYLSYEPSPSTNQWSPGYGEGPTGPARSWRSPYR